MSSVNLVPVGFPDYPEEPMNPTTRTAIEMIGAPRRWLTKFMEFAGPLMFMTGVVYLSYKWFIHSHG